MAGLYSRVAARGFPSRAVAGDTGAGALESQGHGQDPAHGVNTSGNLLQTLPGFDPDTPAPVASTILEGTWGLPGGALPDATPRTHAAPVSGWAGSYADPDLYAVRENASEIHSADFGALNRHVTVHGVRPEPDYDIWSANEPGEAVGLQTIRGQLQAMGGRDDTQGYSLRNGHGFDAGHRNRIVDQGSGGQPMAYLDPAERLFVIPQASGSFTPTDAVQGPGPWWSARDGADINSTDPSAYTPPPDPATRSTGIVGGAASAGWWS